MPYCPNCGNPVTDQLASFERDMPETVPADVQIARINADRDIEIARIQARIDKDRHETELAEASIEASTEMVTATAEAEIIGAALEAGASEPPPPAEIINAPEADLEVADDSPPPVEETEGSQPPAPERKTIGLGAW